MDAFALCEQVGQFFAGGLGGAEPLQGAGLRAGMVFDAYHRVARLDGNAESAAIILHKGCLEILHRLPVHFGVAYAQVVGIEVDILAAVGVLKSPRSNAGNALMFEVYIYIPFQVFGAHRAVIAEGMHRGIERDDIAGIGRSAI